VATQVIVNEELVDVIISETGPQGPRGNTILSGSGEPNIYIGEIGDFYLNTDTQELYGPKTESGWGEPVDLVTNQELGYVHNQGVAATEWTINHGLGFVPNVTVVDSGGSVVEGSYNYPNSNTVVLTFSNPFSGKAYLS
jgi:hypothetical protein